MKSLFVVLSFLSIGCNSLSLNLKDRRMGLNHKDGYLSFVISKENPEIQYSVESKVKLHFNNVSKEGILISKPDCLGVYIMPFLSDTNEVSLPMQFRIKPYCEQKTSKLMPTETYEETFIYDLHECFDFSNKGTYFLRFEYRGNVYSSNGIKISTDEPLISNILEIAID